MNKEYIEKEALLTKIRESRANNTHMDSRDRHAHDTEHRHFEYMVLSAKSADVAPVVKGEWMDYADKLDLRRKRHDYRCPKCGNRADYFVCGTEEWWCAYEPNYCPHCGAYMRKEQG